MQRARTRLDGRSRHHKLQQSSDCADAKLRPSEPEATSARMLRDVAASGAESPPYDVIFASPKAVFPSGIPGVRPTGDDIPLETAEEGGAADEGNSGADTPTNFSRLTSGCSWPSYCVPHDRYPPSPFTSGLVNDVTGDRLSPASSRFGVGSSLRGETLWSFALPAPYDVTSARFRFSSCDPPSSSPDDVTSAARCRRRFRFVDECERSCPDDTGSSRRCRGLKLL